MIRNQRGVQLFVFGAMFAFSAATNGVAPVLVNIQKEFGLSIGASSLVPLLKTLSVMGANLAGSLLIAQLGLRRTIAGALALGAAGSLLLALAPGFWAVCLAGMLLGAGTGATFMGLSSLYSHLEKGYQNFGLFHAFFGVGGIASPLLAAAVQGAGVSYRAIFGIYALVLLFPLGIVLATPLIPALRYERIRLREAGRILSKPPVYLTFLIFFFYSGSEIGIITWNGNLFHNGFGASPEAASLVLSLFWGVFTFGRVMTEFAERRWGPLGVLRRFPFLVAAGVPLLILTGSPVFLAVTALGLAPIFPTAQKYGNQVLTGREAGLYNGAVFLSASVGSSILVTLMGVMADGSVRAAYLIPVAGFLGILLVSRLLPSPSEAPGS